MTAENQPAPEAKSDGKFTARATREALQARAVEVANALVAVALNPDHPHQVQAADKVLNRILPNADADVMSEAVRGRVARDPLSAEEWAAAYGAAQD